MGLSITSGFKDGGIYSAKDMPFYTLFKKVLIETELPEKGDYSLSDKEKLNKLLKRLEAELTELMKQKPTSSKQKHNFVFNDKFYNLDMKSSMSDRTINCLIIIKNMIIQAIETGSEILINIE